MHRCWMWIAASILTVGCEGEGKVDEQRIDDILALTGDALAGEVVFAANCEECHRSSGMGVDDPTEPGIGENLTELGDEEAEELVEDILYGDEEMPAFEDVLSDQQIADVLAYILESFVEAPPTEPPPES